MNKIISFVILVLSLAASNYIYANDLPNRWGSPENLSVLNSAADDFAPTWNNAEKRLYFNSVSSGNSQLYWAEFTSTFNYSKPILMKGLLNDAEKNRAYFNFAQDGTVFLAAYRPSKKYPTMNIATASIQRNAWSEPYFIEALQSDSFDSQPALSPNGNLLIFSSNRLSKISSDLFMSIKQDNGSWSEPVELSEINSAGNEITPYFFSDSLLFFASDGLSGIGGLDIYQAEFYDGLWQRPIPRNDINTEYDESDFMVLPNASAIFCSNRPGGKGGLDFYVAYKISEPIIEPIDNQLKIALKASPAEIRVNNDVKYNIFSLNNRTKIDENIFNIYDSLLTKNDCFEFDFERFNPKDYLLQLALKFSEITNTNFIIKLSKQSDASENTAYEDKVAHLANFLNIDNQSYSFIYADDLPKNTVSIEMIGQNKIKLAISSQKFSFPNLQIECSTSKANVRANCKISISNKVFSQEIADIDNCIFPLSQAIELSKYSRLILQGDELKVSASLGSNNSQAEMLVPIYANTLKEVFSKKINGKKHYIYLLRNGFEGNDYNNFLKENAAVLELIKQNIRIAKSFKLVDEKLGSKANIANIEQFLKANGVNLPLQFIDTKVFDYKLDSDMILLVELNN